MSYYENHGPIGVFLLDTLRNPLNTVTERQYGCALNERKGYAALDCVKDRLRYMAAAVDKDPIALNNVGYIYTKDYIVGQNKALAEQCYLESARLGCTTALVNLGTLMEMEENYERAYQYYREAYLLGDPIGQYHYADLYDRGCYAPQNETFAYRLFLSLAQEHYGDAYYRVATMLHEGRGTEQDDTAALYWHRIGEACGDKRCTRELGLCYWYGRGAEQNLHEAREYLERAVERGDGEAARFLAIAYTSGDALRQDLDRAQYYYAQGAECGDAYCITEIRRQIPGWKSYMEQLEEDYPRPDRRSLMDYRRLLSYPDYGLNNAICAYHADPDTENWRAILCWLLMFKEKGSQLHIPIIYDTDRILLLPERFNDPKGRPTIPVYTDSFERRKAQEDEAAQCAEGECPLSLCPTWEQFAHRCVEEGYEGSIIINPYGVSIRIPIETVIRLGYEIPQDT